MVEPWWWNPVRRPLHTRLWKINTVVRASQEALVAPAARSVYQIFVLVFLFTNWSSVFQNRGQVWALRLKRGLSVSLYRSHFSTPATCHQSAAGVPRAAAPSSSAGIILDPNVRFIPKQKLISWNRFLIIREKSRNLSWTNSVCLRLDLWGIVPVTGVKLRGKCAFLRINLKKEKTGCAWLLKTNLKDVCICGLLGIFSM